MAPGGQWQGCPQRNAPSILGEARQGGVSVGWRPVSGRVAFGPESGMVLESGECL